MSEIKTNKMDCSGQFCFVLYAFSVRDFCVVLQLMYSAIKAKSKKNELNLLPLHTAKIIFGKMEVAALQTKNRRNLFIAEFGCNLHSYQGHGN